MESKENGPIAEYLPLPTRRHPSPAAERRRDEHLRARIGLISLVLLLPGVGTALARHGPFGRPSPHTAVAGVTAVAGPSGGVALWQPIREWQEQRRAGGQDPYDWPAYRAHAQALRGPDPGETAPAGFSP